MTSQSHRASETASPSEVPAPTAKKTGARRKNKREEVLLSAAELIARQGFDGTSMRDIAASVDMLPGSLYYHFQSKEDMLLAIHQRVVADMTEDVEKAIANGKDPWDRLERAAAAHLKGLLGTGTLMTIISPNFAQDREDLNDQLKAHRRGYEELFRDLFSALEVTSRTDLGLLRLQLLGALNWVPVWYDPKGKTKPAQIAKAFVRSIRRDAEE